jgi:hypothetical protein
MSTLTRILSATALLMATGMYLIPGLATQRIAADPDAVVEVYASTKDANIISITGGSIESVWGTEDKVTLEANVDTGQAIFRPTSLSTFTLFVQSHAGNTYTLMIKPRPNEIGQSIVIDEFASDAKSPFDRALNPVSYKNEVKRLLKEIETMPSGKVTGLRGFQVRMVNQEVPLWSETRITHALTWKRGSMAIDKYVLTNISDQALVVEEREFASIGETVRAISIREHQLAPAQSTVFYAFRSVP